MNRRFDTGRQFFSDSLSKPDFFSKGAMFDCLKQLRTVDSLSEQLMIAVISSSKTSVHYFSSYVGKGERSQHLFTAPMTSFRASSSVAGGNVFEGVSTNFAYALI